MCYVQIYEHCICTAGAYIKKLVFESGIGLESKVLLLIFPNEPRAMMNLLFAHF